MFEDPMMSSGTFEDSLDSLLSQPTKEEIEREKRKN